jgi:hypothetical protein
MDINVHRFASVPKKALQIVAKWYVSCSSLYVLVYLSYTTTTTHVLPDTALDYRAHRDLTLYLG